MALSSQMFFFFYQEVSIMLMSFGSKTQVKNYNIKTYTRDKLKLRLLSCLSDLTVV